MVPETVSSLVALMRAIWSRHERVFRFARVHHCPSGSTSSDTRSNRLSLQAWKNSSTMALLAATVDCASIMLAPLLPDDVQPLGHALRRAGLEQVAVVIGEPESRQACRQHLERHAGFQPRDPRADAGVDTAAEGDVAADVTAHHVE